MSIALDLSALDPTFKEHAHRGIGRYVRELKNYFEENRNDQISFFDHRSVLGKFASVMSAGCDYLPAFRQTVKQQIVLPLSYRNKARKNQQVFHFPAHMDAPASFMPPYILTVLDLIPQVFPALYKADKNDWRFKLARYLENKAIRNADMILCISECTARDVINILGIPAEKIRVTHLGVEQKFFDISHHDHKQQFFTSLNIEPDRQNLLYVGGIDPRKNWAFALKVIKELKELDAQNCPNLLFAGNISADKQYPKLKAMIDQLQLNDVVKLLGYLPEEKLLAAYRHSDAFFFPSLYEGFGLPPLEAMAAGLPVVSSEGGAMPEVLGDAAVLFNPSDLEQAVRAIREVLANQPLRQSLADKGRRRARKFTWGNTGKQTEKAYLEYLKARGSHS